MPKQKILKIKMGDAYIDGKLVPVFQTAFKKVSKKGNPYYQTNQPIFIQEIETKENVSEEQVEA